MATANLPRAPLETQPIVNGRWSRAWVMYFHELSGLVTAAGEQAQSVDYGSDDAAAALAQAQIFALDHGEDQSETCQLPFPLDSGDAELLREDLKQVQALLMQLMGGTEMEDRLNRLEEAVSTLFFCATDKRSINNITRLDADTVDIEFDTGETETHDFSPACSGGGGGASDQTVDIGTLTEAINTIVGILDPQNLGLDSANLAVDTFAGTFPAGTLTGSFVGENDTGSEVGAVGTESSNIDVIGGAMGSQALGIGSASASSDLSADVTGHTGLATATADWTGATNAQGAQDGSVASIAAAASGVSGDSASGVLTCDSLGLATPPTGFTRNTVEIEIRQRVDTTVATLSTASCELRAQKAGGAGEFSVFTSTQSSNTRNDGALVVDTYDITTDVSSWTHAELAGIEMEADASFNILALGGNAAWEIDYVHVNINYTETGIA